MSVIKRRTRGKEFVRLITRLERETNETLYAYAAFLGEPVEYVLNELIDTVLAKDKEFVAWRANHPQSCVSRGPAPTGAPRPGPSANRTRETTAVSPTEAPAGLGRTHH